jgi:hypothetical protein
MAVGGLGPGDTDEVQSRSDGGLVGAKRLSNAPFYIIADHGVADAQTDADPHSRPGESVLGDMNDQRGVGGGTLLGEHPGEITAQPQAFVRSESLIGRPGHVGTRL